MPRICNGCLENKPIVDEEKGYCQYCHDNRDVSIMEILKRINKLAQELKNEEKNNETKTILEKNIVDYIDDKE